MPGSQTALQASESSRRHTARLRSRQTIGAGSYRYTVGLDIGGTFVDIVAIDSNGHISSTKVPSRSNVFDALAEGLLELGIPLASAGVIAHGTTIATNALIEKSGAKTLLLTTEGFRDILEIRRTNKGDLFDLHWTPPPPIIERVNRLEISERIAWDGRILKPLDLSGLAEIARLIDKRGIESIAIVFLHAYINPIHERQLRDALQALRPQLHVSISSDVIRSYREFERTATTAANAYIAPVISRYLDSFAAQLRLNGATAQLLMMQSNGGLSSIESCRDLPARTIRSGPAGGATALMLESRRSGNPNLIGIDIGGTTADVSMVVNHRPLWRPSLEVEFGLPIMFPTIDIASIGAGGGTIAWIDKGGALRVGPASAGSEPGPACYGRGGEEATCTDAQLVLGRLSPDSFLGGKMPIYPELAADVINRKVARPLGLSVVEAAAGIVAVLTSSMIQMMRLLTIERGHDPRDFSLCAFGGGGPLFAAELAQDLGISEVIVPDLPGVFSAIGLTGADLAHDASQAILAPMASITDGQLEEHFAVLEQRVLDEFDKGETPASAVSLERYIDLLYSGQTHFLSVPVPPGRFSDKTRSRILSSFHAQFLQRFGHSDATQEVEVVDARVFGRSSPVGKAYSDAKPAAREVQGAGRPVVRPVYFQAARGYLDSDIWPRSSLQSGQPVRGPAVIEQYDSTTIVPPGSKALLRGSGRFIAISRDDNGAS